MSPKRILLVNVRSLLMESVANLLDSNGNFDVVSTLADNLPDLIYELKETQPGVIVIDEMTSFMKAAPLIVSLLNTENIRVIALNSQTSKMDVYDKNEIVVSNSDQFIEALDNEWASSSSQNKDPGGAM